MKAKLKKKNNNKKYNMNKVYKNSLQLKAIFMQKKINQKKN